MEIMKNYADLIREIEIIKNQIELFEIDVDYWYGKNDLPLNGKGAREYGLSVAAERTDKLNEKIVCMNKRLDYYQDIKEDMDKHINSLEGLHYKVAYKRFIENLTYKEIATDMGYSYDYIRHIASESNKHDNTFITQTN